MPNQNRCRFAASCQTVANEGSWSYWRTAGTPGCRRLLCKSWLEEAPVSGARHSHNQVGDRRLARREGPDLEAVRGRRVSQEVTTDIPEDSVTYDQQDVDPKKFGPFRWESYCGSVSRGDSWHTVREKLQLSRLECGRSEWALQVALKALAIFHQLYDGWMTGLLRDRWPETESTETNCFEMIRMAGSERGGVAVPPQALGSISMETSEPVLWLDKEGSCQRRRRPRRPAGVQPGLKDGGGKNAATRSRTASGRQPPMDWRRRPCRCTAPASRRMLRNCRVSQLPAWRPGESLSVPMTRRMRCSKAEAWPDQWYMDDGDIMCHPIVVYARLGGEAEPTENGSHLPRDPSGMSATCGAWPKPLQLATVAPHSMSLLGSRQPITDQLLSKADVLQAMHERVQLCHNPQTEFALVRESMGVSRINHNLASTRPHNPSGTADCRNLRRGWAAVSRTALPGSHGGQHDTHDPQWRPVWNWVQKSARRRCSCTPGSSHRSQTAHPGFDPGRSLGRPSS